MWEEGWSWPAVRPMIWPSPAIEYVQCSNLIVFENATANLIIYMSMSLSFLKLTIIMSPKVSCLTRTISYDKDWQACCLLMTMATNMNVSCLLVTMTMSMKVSCPTVSMAKEISCLMVTIVIPMKVSARWWPWLCLWGALSCLTVTMTILAKVSYVRVNMTLLTKTLTDGGSVNQGLPPSGDYEWLCRWNSWARSWL